MNFKNLQLITGLALLLAGVLLLSGCIQVPGTSKPVFGSNATTINGLPIYPGSQKSGQYSAWATSTGFSNEFSEVYQYSVSGASPSDIINWYKSQFSDYAIANKGAINAQGEKTSFIVLRKGDTMIGVMAFEMNGQTIYFIGRTKAAVEETPFSGMPAVNMPDMSHYWK